MVNFNKHFHTDHQNEQHACYDVLKI